MRMTVVRPSIKQNNSDSLSIRIDASSEIDVPLWIH